jgi:hypothetical protein
MGSQIRYGSRLSASGLRATRKRGGPSTRFSSLRRSTDSGRHCLAVVLADQAAQEHTPENLTRCCRRPDRLVRPVVAPRGCGADVPGCNAFNTAGRSPPYGAGLPPAAAQDTPADSFRSSAQAERWLEAPLRRQDHSNPGRSKDVVSSRRKRLVSVIDDRCLLDPFLFQRPRPVAGQAASKTCPVARCT